MNGPFSVRFLPSAAREFGGIPRAAQRQIGEAIDALAHEPRPDGATLLSGGGPERIWRIRVASYRILYQVTDEALLILVVRIANRRDVYRSAEMKALLKRIRLSRE